jgi:Sap, sulfolipid-1-addressing protein
VLFQAAGFALLAAISPAALLVMAVFLSSAEPRRIAVTYTLGAFVMTVAAAIAALFIIRSAGLNLPRGHDPRYGLRLGLGVLALAGAVFLYLRRRRAAAKDSSESGKASKPGESGKSGKGLMARLTAHPSPRTAFIAGLILFAPSATFLAAVQVIATSNASPAITAIGLLIVVTLGVLLVWVPLIAFFAAPAATTRALAASNGWLHTHGKRLAVAALALGGLILIVNGALGLTGVL